MIKVNPIIFAGTRSSCVSFTSDENPYNTISINSAEQAGKAAIKQIGSMPYRIATAGYSSVRNSEAAAKYESSTKAFLEYLQNELGLRNTAFVTSPSIDKGSIDAITSQVAGFDQSRLFYITAQKYVKYINPAKFPAGVDIERFSKIPKYVLPDSIEYSRATAAASNVLVVTGGGKVAVDDFCNAIKQGNKVIIVNNPGIVDELWAFREDKGLQVLINASKYLTEQLSALKDNEALPHIEMGEFTSTFLNANRERILKLVRIVNMDGLDSASISNSARKAARFIK